MAMERGCTQQEGRGESQLSRFSPLLPVAFSDADRRRTEAPRVLQQRCPVQLQPHNRDHHPVPVRI